MTMVGVHFGWSALRGWLLGLVIALCIVAGLAAPARAEASVYAVNSTTDAADAIRGEDHRRWQGLDQRKRQRPRSSVPQPLEERDYLGA